MEGSWSTIKYKIRAAFQYWRAASTTCAVPRRTASIPNSVTVQKVYHCLESRRSYQSWAKVCVGGASSKACFRMTMRSCQ